MNKTLAHACDPRQSHQSSRRGVLTAMLPALALFFAAASAQPARAQTYVPVARRACVLFLVNLDSQQQTPAQQAFYNFVEFGAKAAVLNTLSPFYGSILVREGTQATRYGLPSALHSKTSNPFIDAVDLIFVTHGLTGGVVFADQTVTMTTVRNDITTLVPNRHKLRMVFSTACYGRSHLSNWIAAGFETASGGNRIYADSATSFVPFLISWAGGLTFQQAINTANAADPYHVQDNLARQVLLNWGYSQWWDVDSTRFTAGATGLRIMHRPF